jgi:hypothetical protein
MASLLTIMMLTIQSSGSTNLFTNTASAQEYYKNDEYRSEYPTNDYKYECQKGPFKGFYVSSVEFCLAHSLDDDKKKKDRPIEKPSTGSLIVTKVVTCGPEDSREAGPFCARIIQAGLGDLSAIQPNDFTIAVSGNNPMPPQFEGSGFPTVVTLDPGNYQVSETADPSVAELISFLEEPAGVVDITQSVIFSGDCDTVSGEGTIAEGEIQICNIENAFTISRPPPGTTTTESNNAITTTTPTTTQSSNVGGVPQSSNIAVPTTTTTQSSNVLPQSNNVGVPQSNNVVGGTTNTFSTPPS